VQPVAPPRAAHVGPLPEGEPHPAAIVKPGATTQANGGVAGANTGSPPLQK